MPEFLKTMLHDHILGSPWMWLVLLVGAGYFLDEYRAWRRDCRWATDQRKRKEHLRRGESVEPQPIPYRDRHGNSRTDIAWLMLGIRRSCRVRAPF